MLLWLRRNKLAYGSLLHGEAPKKYSTCTDIEVVVALIATCDFPIEPRVVNFQYNMCAVSKAKVSNLSDGSNKEERAAVTPLKHTAKRPLCYIRVIFIEQFCHVVVILVKFYNEINSS